MSFSPSVLGNHMPDAAWIGELGGLGKGMLVLIFTFGIVFIVGNAFAGSLGLTLAGNAVSNILLAVNGGLSTYLTPIIVVVFAAAMYGLARAKGIV